MYKLFLSLRYFRSRPINWIPVVCMMLGVMALLVILAVMDGFQDQLKATLRGSLSDVIITVNYESDLDEWEKVLLGMDEVKAISPYLQSFALVAQIPPETAPGEPPPRALMNGAMVYGIDPAREAKVSRFREYLRYRQGLDPEHWRLSTPDFDRAFDVLNPRWDDQPGVILGRQLADRLGVYPPRRVRTESGGEYWDYYRVYLTTMVGADEDSEDRYSARQWSFCVTGIYESGNQEIDEHIAFLSRPTAKEFFELSRDPEEIRVELDDYSHHGKVVSELESRESEIYAATSTSARPWRAHFPPYFVQTWEDRRRNFLNAIQNEKGLIAIIAGMAFIVTGFMIFSILSMIVTMKTRDIGIVKALGGTTRGVLSIFLLNGLIVGVVGSGLGLGLGMLFIRNINSIKAFVNEAFGWEPFPKSIYLFTEIPTRIIPAEVVAVTAMALLVALIGAVLPAFRAARLDPVESLRYE